MSEPVDKASIKSVTKDAITTLTRIACTPLVPMTFLASLPLLSIILAVYLQGPFAHALSNDQTYRVMLITGMLVLILWATELTHGTATPKRKAAWLIISWLLVFAAIIFLVLSAWEYCASNYCAWRTPPVADNVTIIGSFVFFGLLIVALVYRMFGFDVVARDDSANHLRVWGQLAVFGIMVLALFAFGLEIKHSHLEPKWEELPAILIVFVLAELGVHLVAKAEAVRDAVTKAAAAASGAVTASQGAQQASAAAISKAEGAITTAETVSTSAIANLASSSADARAVLKQLEAATTKLGLSAPLYLAASEFISATGIDKDKFWKTLADFVKSWTGEAVDFATGGQNRHFVESLYCQFVEGPGGREGTIRAGKGEVSCVTIDTVYAHVSKEWLRQATDQHKKATKPRVVVWALTSLLPTDFAAPQLWWSPERDKNTHRVRTQRVTSLEQFIGEVLTVCGPDTRVAEYRRVTVLRKPNVDSHSLDTAWELAMDGANLRDGDRMSNWDGLKKCMNQWFVWDPRVLPKSLASIDANCIDNSFTQLADLVRPDTVAPVELGMTAFQSDMFADKFKKDWDICKKQHILPELPAEKSFMIFKDISNARYFVAHHDLLATKCPATEIRATVGRLDGINGAESGSATFEEVARSFGWITLKEWYCSKLHKAPANGGACWAEVDTARDLDGLALQWDEFTWNPLDLLLIGARTESDDDVDWMGGAISNLRFDDPTCIVKLVTDTVQLKRIAKVVETLTNNFSSNGEDASHGTWDEKL